MEYVTESEKICGGGVYQHNSAGCADDAGAYAEMEEENARSREAERLRTSNEASALARMRAARDRADEEAAARRAREGVAGAAGTLRGGGAGGARKETKPMAIKVVRGK